MLLKRWVAFVVVISFAGLSLAGFSGSSHAADPPRSGAGKPSASIVGAWKSGNKTLTFRANGTIFYKGKDYYYAVSRGGTIQLTGKHGGMLAFPYHLAGGKLTLTVNGKATVYTRK